MTAIAISDLRLYFIWVETHLDFLQEADGVKPTSLPLGFLGDKAQYVKAFEEALAGKGPQGLQVPWESGSKVHYFWTHYLENTLVPGLKSGTKAWDKLVPLRWKVPVEAISFPCKPGKITIEAFFFPHGIGVMVTAQCYGEHSLKGAVETALKIRGDGFFEVVWAKDDTAVSCKLDELSKQAFLRVRRYALGPEKAAEIEPVYREPFTVAAIVKGDQVDEHLPPSSEIHKALNALASWPKYDWTNPPPGVMPGLDESQVNMKENYPGDVLYGSKSGRVVWAPSRFKPPQPGKPKPHKISCYARNLGLLSMQVESLGDLILKTRTDAPIDFSNYHEVAENAVKNLSFLYKGEGTTYRSMSAHEQIKGNGAMWAALNQARMAIWGKPPMDPGDWIIP